MDLHWQVGRGLLTFGIAFPWFMARQKAFVVSHHAFGTTRFHCELSASAPFGIYFRAGLIVMAFCHPERDGGIRHDSVRIAHSPRVGLGLAWVAPLIVIYAGYLVSYSYVQARTTNLLWNNTSASGLRFESSLKASRLIGLYLGNVVAAACSGGLLIPWAVVRTLRYRLDNFSGMIEDDITHEANPQMTPVGAAGQELGDIFNLDLGL